MILKATLSKPNENAVTAAFGKPYEKIKFSLKSDASYFAEFFTSTQVFHKHLSETELESFLEEHARKTFRNCVKFTESKEISIMASKKGKISVIEKNLEKKLQVSTPSLSDFERPSHIASINSEKINLNRKKNYILNEGKPIPFLIELGVMTKEGKIVNKMYDKFRQINRFLEYIRDILDDIKNDEGRPIKIVDFGCGKSYLTFAVYYYLNELLSIPVDIVGLDLKADVISNCSRLAEKLGYTKLKFYNTSVENYFASKDNSGDKNGNDSSGADLIITLHACDTATDYVLATAVKQNTKAILSVPCCQHELNSKVTKSQNEALNTMMKYGIVKERFMALATDVMRCELLEENGYSVQLMEFIDMEGTPKNLLIRGVKRNNKVIKSDYQKMEKMLGSDITLANLLDKRGTSC